MKRTLMILLTMIAVLSLFSASAATLDKETLLAPTRSAIVIAQSAPVYEAPNQKNALSIDVLEAGDDVTILSTQNGWARISYSHDGLACLHLGYVSAENLSFAERMIGFAATYTNVYSQPNEFSSKIAVGAGFPIYVIGQTRDFYAVENSTGEMGYMLKKSISQTVPNGSTPFYGNYDPKWEALAEAPLLMLPKYATLYQSANPFARNFQISENTPCYVVGKVGDFYRVENQDRTITAYVNKSSLVPAVADLSRTV